MTYPRRHEGLGPILLGMIGLSLGLLPLGLLAGCGGDSSASSTTSGSSTGAAASTSASTAASPATATASDPSASGAGAGPTASTAPSSDPLVAGRDVFERWARPGLTYAAWWQDLEPLLSPAARQAYQYTDPAQIPSLRITGPVTKAAKAPDLVGLSAMVYVPTNRGRFGLFLTRTTKTSPWLLLRISFPPGIH